MTTLKDSLEASAATTESATASTVSRPKPDAGHLRTDAVSLEVPVKVHGSRVTEVVRGVTPHTEPFEEQTSTMIVFPQGGVLRMATPVAAGQAVVVTNMKSRQDAICRVVKVRAYAEKQSYVEIEFTHPQPGYWGVYFPAGGSESGKKAAGPPQPAPAAKDPAPEVEIHARAKGTPEVSWTPPPASAPKPSVGQPSAQAHNQESAFAQIETREEVQPPASATTTIGDPFAARTKSRAIETSKKSSAAEDIHGSDVVEELTVPSSMASSAENPPATFGRFVAAASMTGSHSAGKEDFGARLDFGSSGAGSEPAKPRNKGLMIATGIAAVLAIAAGVAYYLRNRPFTQPVTPAPAAPIVATMPAPSSSASSNTTLNMATASSAQPGPAVVPSVPSPSSAASVPQPVVHATEVVSAKPAKVPTVAPREAEAATKPKAQSPAPDMFGALNAHPVASKHASAAEAVAAPSLDAAGGTATLSGGLAGPVGGVAGPPPPPRPAPAPIRTGGVVEPPKLISAPAPIYPNIARQAGVEGTVVVEATVGVDGKVKNAKAVSGPNLLREAALDAVRGRKYEPSTLDGQPAPTDISIAIQFHR